MLRHAEAGVSTSEIAWRFRRSPGHIRRVLDLARLPRDRSAPAEVSPGSLRPIERCVLKARASGADFPEIAARMRRTPGFVARVEELATYKLQRGTG